jgi:hypothetical protein
MQCRSSKWLGFFIKNLQVGGIFPNVEVPFPADLAFRDQGGRVGLRFPGGHKLEAITVQDALDLIARV